MSIICPHNILTVRYCELCEDANKIAARAQPLFVVWVNSVREDVDVPMFIGPFPEEEAKAFVAHYDTLDECRDYSFTVKPLMSGGAFKAFMSW